jgi:predicted dehydrogenase
MKKLRYAIVGLGHGMEHVDTIVTNPKTELVHVAI